MLAQCWSSVADGGPALRQHWENEHALFHLWEAKGAITDIQLTYIVRQRGNPRGNQYQVRS